MSLAPHVDALARTLLIVAGVTIRYRRGTQSQPIRAIPGVTDLEAYGLDDDTTSARSDDWILRPRDLSPDFGEPERGDRITNSETGEEFVVLPNSVDERVFRRTDQTGRLWRIHTKLQ